MSFKFLVTDIFHPHALATLAAEIKCEITRSKAHRPTSTELKGAEALLIRSRTKLDKELLKECAQLKFVVTATSGFDHIDLNACKELGITVCHTPDANAASAAELTIALMLNLLRRLPENLPLIERNHWRQDNLRGHTLKGKTLGVVGLGRIGTRVAKTATALGMKVVAYDPYCADKNFAVSGAERVGATELLSAADIITLHVPLTRETYHFINYDTLRLMNRGAYLINTSRGQVIQESELVTALDEGVISGVALDVFEKEPLTKESRLCGRANVIMTPHIGALTEEALEEASLEAVARTVEFFRDGRTINCLE